MSKKLITKKGIFIYLFFSFCLNFIIYNSKENTSIFIILIFCIFFIFCIFIIFFSFFALQFDKIDKYYYVFPFCFFSIFLTLFSLEYFLYCRSSSDVATTCVDDSRKFFILITLFFISTSIYFIYFFYKNLFFNIFWYLVINTILLIIFFFLNYDFFFKSILEKTILEKNLYSYFVGYLREYSLFFGYIFFLFIHTIYFWIYCNKIKNGRTNHFFFKLPCLIFSKDENQYKKISNIPFKLILSVLNLPFLFIAFRSFRYAFVSNHDGNARSTEVATLFLPLAYTIVILTILFQLYLWLLHDKLRDKLSHWWQNKKTKKLN